MADCLPFEIVRSNRNLLDNWYFRRPINQRGITKYTSGYSIDRFIVQNTSEECSLTLENDCVLLKAKNNDGLIQPFEQTMFNAGDVMTCSALLKDGTFLSRAFTITPEVKIYPYDSVWNVTFGQIAGGIWYVWPIITYDRPDPVEARIIAVKLELGTQQTLARKIGDQWVLNDPPPDYGLELLKCQRYFLRQNYEGLETIGNSNAGKSWLNLSIALPVSMRLNIPRCTITCKPTRVVDNLVLPAIAQVRAKGTQANLGFSLTGGALASYIYAGQAGYIDFDANL